MTAEGEGAATERIADSVIDLIGETPMLRLHRVVPPGAAEVCLKLEGFNPAGSVKDRTAWAMIRDAERRGLLQPGATIVEPTSGNTGIGLAMVAAARGYRCVIVLPGDANPERVAFLRAYGAEVVLGPEGRGMPGAIERARAILAERPGSFMPMQFENMANPAIHRETTAVEIVRQTGGRLDAFVATAGTGGTVSGCGRALHALVPGVRVVVVEPAGSPVISGGKPGKHNIPGMGPGFVPATLDRGAFDAILQVTDDEAKAMAGRLAREEGIFVGLSSGAATVAACRVAAELGPGRRVVAVAPDSGDRYFSSGAYGGEA
jgi:cysteine synthase A